MRYTLTIVPQSPLAREIDALFGATSNPQHPIRKLFSSSARAEIGYGTIYLFTPLKTNQENVDKALESLENYPAFLTAIIEAIAAKKTGLEVDIPNNYTIVPQKKLGLSGHEHFKHYQDLISWFCP